VDGGALPFLTASCAGPAIGVKAKIAATVTASALKLATRVLVLASIDEKCRDRIMKTPLRE